jgi:hypothetical protein
MSFKTIVVMGSGPFKEAVLSGVAYPGDLVMRTSAAVDTVAVHGTAKAAPTNGPMFLLEDDLQGKTIADAYASGARVRFAVSQRGDEINVRIKAGETIAKNAALESSGDGTFKAFTDGVKVAMAREVSGGVGITRCIAEIL